MTRHTKSLFIKTLEELYQKALSDENLSLAVKIKELQGKILGYFDKNTTDTLKGIKSLKDLNDEELRELLKKLEK